MKTESKSEMNSVIFTLLVNYPISQFSLNVNTVSFLDFTENDRNSRSSSLRERAFLYKFGKMLLVLS